MADKEKKTAAELEELMMTEIRKLPELDNIMSADITPPGMPKPGGPTWECNYVTDGAAPARVFIADEIKRKIQDQFDLI
jgi:hypothetical protein